jgi:hypothetical protein
MGQEEGRLEMINISGAFVYEPPFTRLDISSPATFLIWLMIVGEDGVPVFNPRTELHRLSATAVLAYPQISPGEQFPLALTNLAFLGPSTNFVTVLGVFNTQQTTLPPAAWAPAALLIQLDNTWGAIITAAAPAVPNSGIAIPVRTGPVATQGGQ